MNELISSLQQLINASGKAAFFNGPATQAEIDRLSEMIKLPIPADLQTFYLHFNGGFIVDKRFTEGQTNASHQEIKKRHRVKFNYVFPLISIYKILKAA
ncbi:MAG TPA: SMI1/KNR4 family protein [Chitinophagaceae bacterium]|nr:SMI1/KNR4 family protein [Chitinophagaceae bacterium]